MKRLKFLLLGCAFLLLFVTPVAAAPVLYEDFCPEQLSCPSSVTEASLSFEEVLTGTDPNDYNLRITLTGGATAPAYVDELSFTIAGVGTPSGFETVPVILAYSAGTGWTIVYDNVSGSATNSCVTSTNNSNEVCLASGPGSATNLGAPLTNNTVTFDVFVNITDTGLILTSQTEVNLRAQFVDAEGKNVGILSPEPQMTSAPEPTSLVLLGTGLVGLAKRYRRNRNQRLA